MHFKKMSTPYQSQPSPYSGKPAQAAAALKNIDLEMGMPESGGEPADGQGATKTSNISICGLFNIAITKGQGERSYDLTASATGMLVLFILWLLIMLYILQDLEFIKEL